jgi:hypothetical protein
MALILDMASFEFLAIILTGLGLTASITYYASILRNNTKTTQNAILYQRFNTNLEYQKALMEVIWEQEWKTLEEHGKMDIEARAKSQHILNHYNALGLLLKKKATDPDLLMSLYTPTAILTVCTKFEKIVGEMREGANDPRHFEGISILKEAVLERYPDVNLIPTAKA